MKKVLFTLFILIAITACGDKKNSRSQEAETVPAVITSEGESEGSQETYTGEDTQDGFSNVAAYKENPLKDICVISEMRNIGDPQLEELYGDLRMLQERADEWAKIPRSKEELREITREIGRIKGSIEYRSLRAYAAVS